MLYGGGVTGSCVWPCQTNDTVRGFTHFSTVAGGTTQSVNTSILLSSGKLIFHLGNERVGRCRKETRVPWIVFHMSRCFCRHEDLYMYKGMRPVDR